MNYQDKIIWAEGILLGPQHFQVWEYNIYNQLRVLSQLIAPYSWGILELEIAENLLAENRFSITRCHAILPSGLFIHHHQEKDPPLGCDLTKIENRITDLYLAVAINQQVANIPGYNQPQAQPSWIAYQQLIPDQYDQTRKREVTLGRLNLQLLTKQQLSNQFYGFKIAEIIKTDCNQYQINQNYTAPTPHLANAKELQRILVCIVNQIKTKLQEISNNTNWYNEVDRKLLLQNLYSSYNRLSNLKNDLSSHPQALYAALIKTINNLAAFNGILPTEDLPEYKHTQLSLCFQRLQQLLQKILGNITPRKITTIKLLKNNTPYYYCEHIEENLFSKDLIIIAITTQSEETISHTNICRHAKVSSLSRIENIIAVALTGIELSPFCEQKIINSLNEERLYFNLDNNDPLWLQIIDEKAIAFFLPGNREELKIELIGI